MTEEEKQSYLTKWDADDIHETSHGFLLLGVWLLVLSTMLGLWVYKLAVSVIHNDIFTWLVSMVFIFACVFFVIVDSRALIEEMNARRINNES